MKGSSAMNRTYVRGVTLAAVLTLAACSGSDGGSGPQWDDYAPGLRGQIDTLQVSKDCAGLQAIFDNADANSEATKARTGHNSAELMKYIDTAMRAAGCYGS